MQALPTGPSARAPRRHGASLRSVPTDHTALRSSLLGAVQPTLLDHTRLQPLRDHPPRGERAEHGQDVVVRDAVERAGQIGVQRPLPLGAFALHELVDGLDRVMAAAAGPEPVVPRLEPSLPLGLQCAHDPCLVAAVENHRIHPVADRFERAALAVLRLLRVPVDAGGVCTPSRDRLSVRGGAAVRSREGMGSQT